MEKEAEENNEEMHKLIVKTPDWLDLPEPIATNIILEHLDLVDYIQFSAVCKTWLSIHKQHLISYSPYPPPSSRSFPWLTYNRCLCKQNFISFCSPDKTKWYDIPLFATPKYVFTMVCGHGWLLLLLNIGTYHRSMCIFNPTTGIQIELPPFILMQDGLINFCNTHISSPPADPNCTILLTCYGGKRFLCRLNDNNGWKLIDYSNRIVLRTVFFNNKIYTMADDFDKIYMLDTLCPDSVDQTIKMDFSEICTSFPHIYKFDLMDFIGELVMIFIEYDYLAEDKYENIADIHVYRADFSTNSWVRMETLRDHALFYSWGSTYSLPTDFGFMKNNIYLAGNLKCHGPVWRAFNLITKEWTDGPTMSPPRNVYHLNDRCWSWFFPTLDYFNVA